jgi:CHAD domain-containing protein
MRGLTAETHTWLGARLYLRERCDDFFLQVTRVREGFDPEAIHDLRVSSRRLRECLNVFAACFRKRQVTELRKELKALTNYLGAIRNTDEALFFFSLLAETARQETLAALQKIIASLQTRRISEQRDLRQEVKRIDPASLLERIDQLCHNLRIFDPDSAALFLPVAETLQAAIAAREQSILDILPDARQEAEVAAQHRLRIAVKRFRYRFEFMAPIVSRSDYLEIYSNVKKYQELLGHMHDLDVFAGTADELLSGSPGTEQLKLIIASRRQSLFTEFLELSDASPFPLIIDKVRSLT